MTDPSPLTHFDAAGRAQMVDVGDKPSTLRIAVATGRITMRPETISLVREGRAAKGDVLGVAQVAAIMAAKRTADLIPMCHPLALTKVTIAFDLIESDGEHAEASDRAGTCAVAVRAQVETRGQTGVEMEALTAATVAALTIYDMVKAVDRAMTIEAIRLETKSGGASGDWKRDAP